MDNQRVWRVFLCVNNSPYLSNKYEELLKEFHLSRKTIDKNGLDLQTRLRYFVDIWVFQVIDSENKAEGMQSDFRLKKKDYQYIYDLAIMDMKDR